MQIHEITLARVDEGLLNLAKKAGSAIAGTTVARDLAGAVSAPFQKAAAVMSTPGAMTDPHAYRDAMQKFRAGQVAALEPQVQAKLAGQIAQKTQQRAKELAQSWLQHVKSKQPRPRLKSAPTPIKPTGQYSTKPTTSTTVDMQTGRPVEPPAQIKEQTSGAPTPAELAKFQQKVAAAEPKTGFAAVSTPKVYGGRVPYSVTQPPKNILTGTRAREFENWANQQLTSKIPGTNVVLSIDQIKKQYPEVRQALNTAMTKIIRGNNDPVAIEQYLMTAMQAMQQHSQKLKQSGAIPRAGAGVNSVASGVLDRYVDSVTKQKLQSLAKNPAYAQILKQELGIQ